MSDRLVLFVHGLGGTPQGTWGNFERLLLNDADLTGIKVGYFAYPTFIFRLPFGPRYPGVLTLAQGLATQINNRYSSFDDITLVCHSLGGLIGKQYLIDTLSENRVLRVKRALLYAVPNHGAGLASVATFISWRHPQLRQLCKEADVIRTIAQGWERTKAENSIDVRYVIAALDKVVDEHSARQTWANDRVETLVDRGHVDAVKPRDADDLAYLILRNQLRNPIVRAMAGAALASFSATPAEQVPGTSIGAEPATESELRIAVSAILRIERDGKYLLVRNLHRPESFAPFGGVYKFFPQAKGRLDAFSFRPQAVDSDMRNDIRGFIAPEALPLFREWLATGSDRENAQDCLRRELREELGEVGLTGDLVPPGLQFRHVRSVPEGPAFVPALGKSQFRIFDVYDLLDEVGEAKSLVDTLVEHSKTSPHLLWVDAESAKRGRAPSREVIAAHTPYFFGAKRYRDGDPPFAGS